MLPPIGKLPSFSVACIDADGSEAVLKRNAFLFPLTSNTLCSVWVFLIQPPNLDTERKIKGLGTEHLKSRESTANKYKGEPAQTHRHDLGSLGHTNSAYKSQRPQQPPLLKYRQPFNYGTRRN